MSGFGCSLFSRYIMQDNSFSDAPESTTPDGWWWNEVIRKSPPYKTVELYNIMEISHLDLDNGTN